MTQDEKKLTEKLAANVARMMGKRKLTQSDLAKKIGVTHSFISRLTHRKRSASLDTICRLAKALDTTPKTLLFG